MNKKTVVLAVLGTLAVVLVGRSIFISPMPDLPANAATGGPAASETDGTGTPAPAAAPQGGPVRAAGATAAAARIDLDELVKGVQAVDFYYDPRNLPRNPMTPLVGAQAVFAHAADGDSPRSEAEVQAEARMLASRMNVTGIIWDKQFPVAVVNDDVVARGDILAEGVVVESIEPDRVILQVGGSSIPLSLKTSEER